MSCTHNLSVSAFVGTIHESPAHTKPHDFMLLCKLIFCHSELAKNLFYSKLMPHFWLRLGILKQPVCRSGRDWPNLFDGTKRLKKSPTDALSKPRGTGLLPARGLFTQNGIKLAVAQTIMPFCRLLRRPFTTRLRLMCTPRGSDVTAQVDGGFV